MVCRNFYLFFTICCRGPSLIFNGGQLVSLSLAADGINRSYIKTIMINNTQKLLEKYIVGKDLDRHEMLEKIYCPNAIVLFEIKADNIDFPSEIHGNVEIAKVLSADFNRKYDLVKTYFLSNDFPENKTLLILKQKWLVVMKEKATGNIRVGTGYYDWEFENQKQSELKIKKHKIFIHTMLELPSKSINLLHDIQNTINYPWEKKETVAQVLQSFEELNPVCNYLK